MLLALKATAKQLGLIAKLPAARGEGWRASIQGLTVEGHTKRVDDHSLEVFHVAGPCDQAHLFAFAEHIAAIAGKQAIVGETDDDFWFVDAPAKAKTKKKKGKR
ncbi:MAG TPA: hypothetical protein VMZ53_21030 [Kofleriaceae bacterium]|nr:hypothetical protein [Kofleriaceae bacterium]